MCSNREGVQTTKIKGKKRRHEGMKFHSTPEEKGNYTSQISMKLQTVAEEPDNTTSTGKRWKVNLGQNMKTNEVFK